MGSNKKAEDKLALLKEKIIDFCVKAKNSYTNTIENALPSQPMRIAAYCGLVLMLGLFAYLLAVLHLGIWVNEFSVIGLIQAYSIRKASYPWGVFLTVSGGCLAYIYLTLLKLVKGDSGRGFTKADTNVYGSAREITKAEIQDVAEIAPSTQVTGTILGQLDKTEENVIATKYRPQSNGNILVFGPPGSGKSFNFVKPTLLQAVRSGKSVVVTDTKGELWADTAEYARKHGYIVRRYDLKNPAYSDGWDVLGEMRHDDNRTLVMAKTIMKNTGNEKDIHAAAEESLLEALLLYQERVVQDPNHRTLYDAYLNLADMSTFEASIQGVDEPFLHSAYSNYASGSENLRGNVRSGLANRLSILASPTVKNMTSFPDLNFEMIGQEKTIIYLVCSDQHETMKFLATLFYSFAFLDLVELADRQKTQRLPVPVIFLMEEFANLGEVPDITKKLATCRSRGIDIMLVVQSMAQLRDIYGENATNTILNNCATYLALAVNDPQTAEFINWRSGEVSVTVQTQQHEYGESPVILGRKYSEGTGRRSLYTEHELVTMQQRKCYIAWQAHNCLVADTFGFNRHPAVLMGETMNISTEVKVPLNNITAKNIIREYEINRVNEYKTWVAKKGKDVEWTGYDELTPLTEKQKRDLEFPKILTYEELEDYALAEAERKTEEIRAQMEQKRKDIVNGNHVSNSENGKNNNGIGNQDNVSNSVHGEDENGIVNYNHVSNSENNETSSEIGNQIPTINLDDFNWIEYVEDVEENPTPTQDSYHERPKYAVKKKNAFENDNHIEYLNEALENDDSEVPEQRVVKTEGLTKNNNAYQHNFDRSKEEQKPINDFLAQAKVQAESAQSPKPSQPQAKKCPPSATINSGNMSMPALTSHQRNKNIRPNISDEDNSPFPRRRKKE